LHWAVAVHVQVNVSVAPPAILTGALASAVAGQTMLALETGVTAVTSADAAPAALASCSVIVTPSPTFGVVVLALSPLASAAGG
jgi:hypothetical protein